MTEKRDKIHKRESDDQKRKRKLDGKIRKERR